MPRTADPLLPAGEYVGRYTSHLTERRMQTTVELYRCTRGPLRNAWILKTDDAANRRRGFATIYERPIGRRRRYVSLWPDTSVDIPTAIAAAEVFLAAAHAHIHARGFYENERPVDESNIELASRPPGFIAYVSPPVAVSREDLTVIGAAQSAEGFQELLTRVTNIGVFGLAHGVTTSRPPRTIEGHATNTSNAPTRSAFSDEIR